MKKDITWSIVSHKQGKLVDKLLTSFQVLDYKNFEFIITINIPESLEFLEKYKHFKIKIIENITKKGYGENHNQAFAYSKSKFFGVLNPDTDVANLDIRHIYEVFSKYKYVGALTVKCYDEFGKTQDHVRKFPNIFVNLLRFLKIYSGDNIYPNKIEKIEWASGSFLIFHRNSFKCVKGFDERFFLYFEDVDICKRLKIHGYDVIYTPKTSFIHQSQRKSRTNFKFLGIHIKSMFRFYFKNYSHKYKNSNITFICVNLSYFLSHRIAAYKAAIDSGMRVSLVCNVDTNLDKTKNLQIEIYDINWKRNTFNIFEWIKNIYNLRKIMNGLYPKFVHCIALHSIFFYTLAYPFNKIGNFNIYSLMGLGFFGKFIRKKSIIYTIIKLFFRFLGTKKNIFYQVQNLYNKDLLIIFGININKIKIIPGSGVQIQNYKKSYKISDRDVNFGFAGRLLKIKGIDTLLDAFHEINKISSNFNLNIAGDVDRLNPTSLSNLSIKDLKKNKNIKFEGFVSDIGAFWKKNDIAVLPSHNGEGIPKALIEAASFGLPIITSDAEGCIDFADKGKNAIITKVGDHLSLSSEMYKLSKNVIKRKQIGKAAQNQVKNKYNFEKIQKCYKDHYRDIELEK